VRDRAVASREARSPVRRTSSTPAQGGVEQASRAVKVDQLVPASVARASRYPSQVVNRTLGAKRTT